MDAVGRWRRSSGRSPARQGPPEPAACRSRCSFVVPRAGSRGDPGTAARRRRRPRSPPISRPMITSARIPASEAGTTAASSAASPDKERQQPGPAGLGEITARRSAARTSPSSSSTRFALETPEIVRQPPRFASVVLPSPAPHRGGEGDHLRRRVDVRHQDRGPEGCGSPPSPPRSACR